MPSPGPAGLRNGASMNKTAKIIALGALGISLLIAPAAQAALGATASAVARDSAVPAVSDATLQTRVEAAAAHGRGDGWNSAVAVIDTQTGRAYTAGAKGTFAAESTMKVLIGAYLLKSDQMYGDVTTRANRMIERSDDAAADALFSLTPGDGLLAWAERRYGVEIGTGPEGAGWWGSNQVTALGMARLLAALKQDPEVYPWLSKHMGLMSSFAADGTAQNWGIKAAAPSAAVKQGWGSSDSPSIVTTPSIGYVDGGRYAVAIYTLHTPPVAWSSGFAMVTQQARILMPGGGIA